MPGCSDITQNLQQMISDLKTAIENKSDSVLGIVRDILSIIKENGIESVQDINIVPCVQFVLLLRWQSNDVLETVAHVFAEVAKCPAGRERLATLQPPIAQQLVHLLEQKAVNLSNEENAAVTMQVCRALGNLCVDSVKGQKSVLDANGMAVLMSVLNRVILMNDEISQSKKLRSVVVGFLRNLTVSEPESHAQMMLANGCVESLCRVIELDGLTEDGVDATSHATFVLSILADECKNMKDSEFILTYRMCKAFAEVLKSTGFNNIDLFGEILELLHDHCDNEFAALSLAESGLCDVLVSLLDKQKDDLLDEDEDILNIFKMATEVNTIVLGHDKSMYCLYEGGQSLIYKTMLNWLHSEHKTLQTSAVLSVGNFARSDDHCIKMVQESIHEELFTLLKRYDPSSENTTVQYAVLSALKNIAIPAANKPVLLKDGAMAVLLPFVKSSMLNIIFKLLATLRMLIEGQESAAVELGTNRDFITNLSVWSAVEFHAGLQAEACRLIAWLVKHSKSKEVTTTIVDCGALNPMIRLLSSDFAVMRNEALLSLTIVAAMNLPKAQPSLTEAEVGTKLAALLTQHGNTMEKPMLCNVLALLGKLITSETLLRHLSQTGVNDTLSALSTSRNDMSDLDPLVGKLSAALRIN